MGLIDGFAVYGATITDILNQWADYGVFAYVLPFLMIFAVVFGVLNKTGLLGDNKGVQATISIVIGLLSLQFDYVPNFFASIFPYAGIGIAILLVAIILMGLLSKRSGAALDWILFSVGAITFLTILYVAWEDSFLVQGGFFSREIWNMVWTLVAIGTVIAITMVWATKKDKEKGKDKED